jgi:fructan beta-fructosidase
MNNWAYARLLPTGSWRGAMTVPREVGLIRTEEGGYLLTQRPVAEIRNFRDDTSKVELSDRTIDTPGIPLDTLVGDALTYHQFPGFGTGDRQLVVFLVCR